MAAVPGIDLLRHGETEAGQAFIGSTDAVLTAHGWQQMAAAISGKRYDLVISSPLSRCASFAEQAAAGRDIPLLLESRWQEMDFGNWEGRTAAELMHSDAGALARLWEAPEQFVPPMGEAVSLFRERVLGAWRDCQRQYSGSVLVVTHAGVIRVLLASLYPDVYPSMMQVNVAHGSLHPLSGLAAAAGRTA